MSCFPGQRGQPLGLERTKSQGKDCGTCSGLRGGDTQWWLVSSVPFLGSGGKPGTVTMPLVTDQHNAPVPCQSPREGGWDMAPVLCV